ncbi:zinc finger CCHC domain-containing protein 7-like [Centruroides vittatus]|uniref:zinc finger CCHC domain-containing protein 7-like n=1 Tax=Centruroides vittatus TaxID=120091 RepID=UPI0035108CCF
MAYVFDDDIFNEDYALEESDREQSDEDRIDSDVEIALYSQIHFAENESYEVIQTNAFTRSKLNLARNLLDTESKTCNGTTQGDVKNPITISSDTSSNSDDVKVVSEFKPASSVVPEVIIFDDKDSVKGEFKERKSWCNEFVSITYSDNDETVQTPKRDDTAVVNFFPNSTNKSTVFNLKERFCLENAKTKNLSASLTNDVDSDSSEDLFKYPSSSKDNICINVSPDSSENFERYNDQVWYVSNQDLYQSQKSRYYNKTAYVMCCICLERGHRMRDCTKPKKEPTCYLCGYSGHIGRKCPRGSCEICLSLKHRTKKCKAHMETELEQTCKLCQLPGHIKFDCPDFWRRYHLTRENKPIKQSERSVNNNAYCYNCGKKGHFGHLCYELRMDERMFPTIPFIMSYDSPFKKDKQKADRTKELVKKRKKKKRKTKRSNIDNSALQTSKTVSPKKCLQNVTDLVNLLHVPKERAKSQKKRLASRKNRLCVENPAESDSNFKASDSEICKNVAPL